MTHISKCFLKVFKIFVKILLETSTERTVQYRKSYVNKYSLMPETNKSKIWFNFLCLLFKNSRGIHWHFLVQEGTIYAITQK